METLTPAYLLKRLEHIGVSLRDTGQALALLGLGSVGLDRSRLDAFSDLDFFAIVEPGSKSRFIQNLDWLAAVHPLDWHFQNTADGSKALMTDGVFCEFAVFEPHELARIPFAPGQVVWRREGFDTHCLHPQVALPSICNADETWIVGEALSCLFVGMQRWSRGEWLSASRCVQSQALDRLIELDALRRKPLGDPSLRDPFASDRRLERRQPELAAELALLVPGYQHTPSAAWAILDALTRRGAVLNLKFRCSF
jgi:hypothetical protein